ncbi:MAG TPA: hypothetical protein VG983_00105, partial [Caulobacterales bacterium]|nr:hypothetical protein [Caulobacterales bacterium]
LLSLSRPRGSPAEARANSRQISPSTPGRDANPSAAFVMIAPPRALRSGRIGIAETPISFRSNAALARFVRAHSWEETLIVSARSASEE